MSVHQHYYWEIRVTIDQLQFNKNTLLEEVRTRHDDLIVILAMVVSAPLFDHLLHFSTAVGDELDGHDLDFFGTQALEISVAADALHLFGVPIDASRQVASKGFDDKFELGGIFHPTSSSSILTADLI